MQSRSKKRSQTENQISLALWLLRGNKILGSEKGEAAMWGRGRGGGALWVLLFPSLSRRKWPLFLNILPLCWDCGSDVGLTQAVLTFPTSGPNKRRGHFHCLILLGTKSSARLDSLGEACLCCGANRYIRLFIVLSFRGGSDLFRF